MTKTSEIFILDDEELNVGILVEALRGEYHVSVGLNSLEALEDIVRLRPDLILLDVMMPKINGFDMCRRLKKMKETREIPIIFITAKSDVHDEILGFELGAVDYLTKPISPSLVRIRVRNHLELLHSQRKLRELSDKLSRYLSPQLYKSIFEGKREVMLETKRKKLTIFFSDIVGFTASTEQMEPEDLNFVLNGYLQCMSQIVHRHGGVLDKFIGDAILIFFGDLESRGVKEDALACVKMALEMRKEVHSLRANWFRHGISIPFAVRMGIATGFCTVGNFGCKDRMDYTVIGGQVNLASRLETEAAAGEIMISSETWALVKDEVFCQKRGQVMVKGISRPVDAYDVIDLHVNCENLPTEMTLDAPGFSLQMEPRSIPLDDKNRLIKQLQTAIGYLEN